MLKTLIRKQLMEIFQSWFVDGKTGRAKGAKGTRASIIGFAALFLLCGAALFAMGMGLSAALVGIGIDWLYFALVGLIAIVLGVFASVFSTYASVYLPKDNEQMLALPIPNHILVLSRTAGVYLLALLYAAWVWIPTTIAYWVRAGITVATAVFPVLLLFAIALFCAVLSCILGWVVALLSAKSKGKSLITVLLSIIGIAVYIVVYYAVVGYLQDIMQHIDELTELFSTRLHYLYLLGTAAEGNALALLAFTAITLMLGAACLLVLAKTFRKGVITTAGTARTRKPVSFAQVGVRRALERREFRHFGASPTWMINGALGVVILLALAVACVIFCSEIREVLEVIAQELPGLAAALPVVCLLATCLVVTMDIISAAAISLEGPTLWILQSLPIDPRDALSAKESMAVKVNAAPAIIAVLAIGIVFQFDVESVILSAAAMWLFVWLVADFGLFLDLRNPNLTWMNEAAPIKQSKSVVIALFGGWAFCAVVGVGGFFLVKIAASWVVLFVCALLFAILRHTLHKWIETKGAEIFASL